LTFTEEDVGIIADSFAGVLREHRYTCYACAIMPDHVHVLIRKHRDKAEQMLESLQAASRDALFAAARRSADHPVWGGPGWKVFLGSRGAMERVVKYIRENPIKIGLPGQHWEFVAPYTGWVPW
jgi:REP element-mobilizing transposase RayT